MTTHRLKAYLELERQMLALDAAEDPLADRLRDAMDPLWYALTDEEHSKLDARLIGDTTEAPLKLPVGNNLLIPPPRVADPVQRTAPLRVEEWEYAA